MPRDATGRKGSGAGLGPAPHDSHPTRPPWLSNGGPPSKTLLTLSKTLLTFIQKGLKLRGSSLGDRLWPTFWLPFTAVPRL